MDLERIGGGGETGSRGRVLETGSDGVLDGLKVVSQGGPDTTYPVT